MKNKFWLALGLLLPLAASATPVTWRLDDVMVGNYVRDGSGHVISDFGVALTGTFTYDADLNLYSNLDITSQTGIGLECFIPAGTSCNGFALTTYAGYHYDFAANNIPSVTSLSLVGLNFAALADGIVGDSLLFLKFDQALTDAGGSVGFDTTGASVEFLCPNTACSFEIQTNPFRSVRFTDVTNSDGTVVTKYSGRVVSVPEPSTLTLLGLGIVALARRRKKTY